MPDNNAFTCLVIDDVRTSRLSAKMHLEQLKFNTLEAANTAEAKGVLNSVNVNFLLLDWHLENESGVEFCKELKAQYGQQLKIIIMSGVEDTSASEDIAKAHGADAFMRKPTTIGAIIESLIVADIEFIS